MRIRDTIEFSTPPKEYDPRWMENFLSALEITLVGMSRGINGGLGLGNGTDIDNLIGKWLTYNTNGSENTEDTLTHDLGVVPIGFLVLKPPRSGVINIGPSTWTTSNLYLQCSAASQTATIFVMIESHGITV